MKQKNKYRWIAVYLGIAIVLTLTIHYTAPLERHILIATFILGEKTGFDLDPDKLAFGMITKGQSATRKITIENPHDRTIRVTITSRGEISKGLIVSENDFLLEPQETKELSFSLYADNYEMQRTYKGAVEIVFWRT